MPQKYYFIEAGRYEISLRPRNSSTLKFCHWNLNALAAQEFTKLSLLEGYINDNDIDTICLSETIFDSSIPIDNNR